MAPGLTPVLPGRTVETGRAEIIRNRFQAIRTWDIKTGSFPEEIKARGLGDATLPEYPWRDDGKLIWEAIHKYVASYLQHFYPSDQELQRDAEVQVCQHVLLCFGQGSSRSFSLMLLPWGILTIHSAAGSSEVMSERVVFTMILVPTSLCPCSTRVLPIFCCSAIHLNWWIMDVRVYHKRSYLLSALGTSLVS
ncbi:MAG: hypothetical protein HC767_04005 [Akkermansiaceae bacterium]|nr:hypothetical protein [Akkermansiaceae bacterium]